MRIKLRICHKPSPSSAAPYAMTGVLELLNKVITVAPTIPTMAIGRCFLSLSHKPMKTGTMIAPKTPEL